jgi:hypothetical protein
MHNCMSAGESPTELPQFLVDGFVEEYPGTAIDRTEFIAEGLTWRGPTAPTERHTTL